MEDFASQLRDGKGAERLIAMLFRNKGLKVTEAPEGWFQDWDLVIEGETMEVKYDKQAHRTGNLFIETSYKGKPGGVNSTRAKWFCCVTDRNIYLMLTEELRKFLTEPIEGARFIDAGDNKASTGWLIPLKEFKTVRIPTLRARER